jgi:hypothetical protein
MVSDTYLTPREAASYLRTSTSTLAKRRLSGDGPAFARIGRAIRYRVVHSTSERPSPSVAVKPTSEGRRQ